MSRTYNAENLLAKLMRDEHDDAIYSAVYVRNVIGTPDYGPFRRGDIILVIKNDQWKFYEWRFTAYYMNYYSKALTARKAEAKIAAGARARTGKWRPNERGKWELLPCQPSTPRFQQKNSESGGLPTTMRDEESS